MEPYPSLGADTSAVAYPASESILFRPVSHVDRLLVNTVNAVRYVTEGKSESDGVREIRAILERSRFEEFWAYVPDAAHSLPGRWHEIGRGETSDMHHARVPVDWSYLDALMIRNRMLTLYHFHPLAYFGCAGRSACSWSLHPSAGPATRDARWIADIQLSMPSPADIHFMMETTWLFHQHKNGGGAIRHRVVTPHGIVDYALTEAGLARYASDRGARTQGLYIPWVAASTLADDSIRSIVSEIPSDYAGILERLAERLSTRYLKVTYSRGD